MSLQVNMSHEVDTRQGEPWSKLRIEIVLGLYRVLIKGLSGFIQGVLTMAHMAILGMRALPSVT